MKTLESGQITEYIGDGVYAIYDGWGIELRANHHLDSTDKIFLEPEVFDALVKFKELVTKTNQKPVSDGKISEG